MNTFQANGMRISAVDLDAITEHQIRMGFSEVPLL
jgi:hypothetical protein